MARQEEVRASTCLERAVQSEFPVSSLLNLQIIHLLIAPLINALKELHANADVMGFAAIAPDITAILLCIKGEELYLVPHHLLNLTLFVEQIHELLELDFSYVKLP